LADKVLVPSDNGTLLALNTYDGSVSWTFVSRGWISNPVIVDRVAYVTDNQGMAAVDYEKGGLLWRVDAGGKPERFCMVVVHGDSAFYGTEDGRLHRISVSRRKKIWSLDLPGCVINGPFCYQDGFLYVGLHAPIRILKIEADTLEVIRRDTGSGLTRSGMQVTDDYLLVFGVHNPGCVHAPDLSRFFGIKRRKTTSRPSSTAIVHRHVISRPMATRAGYMWA
jgi:outer membrane protein assembly factor BamB